MIESLEGFYFDLSDSGLGALSKDSGNPALEQISKIPPSEFFSADVWHSLKSTFTNEFYWQGTLCGTWQGKEWSLPAKGFKVSKSANSIFLIRDSSQDIQQEIKKISRMAQLVSVGEVSSGIAHEINTPLSILMGKAALIKRSLAKSPPDLEKIKTDCGVIEEVIGRIALMVKGIRNLAKSGDQDPFVMTDMLTIIENLRAITIDKATRTGVQLTFEGSSILLECREIQVAQVLLNLVNNAFDAIEGSQVKWIMVRWTLEGSYVAIRVTDSGPRLSEDLAQKIMLPYFSTKAPGKGTGLGLSLSRSIVQIHGGTLTLNRNSENMEFLIHLPLKHQT